MLSEKIVSKPSIPNETINGITDDPIMRELLADTAQTTLQEQIVGEGKSKSFVPVDGVQKMVYDHEVEDLFEGSQNWAALAFSGNKN